MLNSSTERDVSKPRPSQGCVLVPSKPTLVNRAEIRHITVNGSALGRGEAGWIGGLPSTSECLKSNATITTSKKNDHRQNETTAPSVFLTAERG